MLNMAKILIAKLVNLNYLYSINNNTSQTNKNQHYGKDKFQVKSYEVCTSVSEINRQGLENMYA